MYNTRPFYLSDTLNFNLVNLDKATESYSIEYYAINLLKSSEDCFVCTNDYVVGYLIAKHEFKSENSDTFNGHVTALSISPFFRKNNVASFLMDLLARNSILNKASFIDLYVREGNVKAIKFYKKKGYRFHEHVKDYYLEPRESAYDMRLYLKNIE